MPLASRISNVGSFFRQKVSALATRAISLLRSLFLVLVRVTLLVLQISSIALNWLVPKLFDELLLRLISHLVQADRIGDHRIEIYKVARSWVRFFLAGCIGVRCLRSLAKIFSGKTCSEWRWFCCAMTVPYDVVRGWLGASRTQPGPRDVKAAQDTPEVQECGGSTGEAEDQGQGGAGKRAEEVAQREARSTEREAELDRREGQIAEKEAELAQRGAQLTKEKVGEFSQWEAQLTKKQAELRQRGEEIAEKEADLAQREARFAELGQRGKEVVEKEAGLAQREARLAKKQAELDQRGGEVTKKQAELAQREAQCTQKHAELDQRELEVARREKESMEQEGVIEDDELKGREDDPNYEWSDCGQYGRYVPIFLKYVDGKWEYEKEKPKPRTKVPLLEQIRRLKIERRDLEKELMQCHIEEQEGLEAGRALVVKLEKDLADSQSLNAAAVK
ncbi:hypothetical protein DM02DRAFT_666777 [Periconia macrospinosa]|uniref:Uncharacterized protein n=1 Tax=Periconia macrospinosa TaxID=97972 RepID=A0A2V1ECQ2_9PLEO|nr:hypothetical protein DM02DRAFT_666777 [Periconia macrospinosa]